MYLSCRLPSHRVVALLSTFPFPSLVLFPCSLSLPNLVSFLTRAVSSFHPFFVFAARIQSFQSIIFCAEPRAVRSLEQLLVEVTQKACSSILSLLCRRRRLTGPYGRFEGYVGGSDSTDDRSILALLELHWRVPRHIYVGVSNADPFPYTSRPGVLGFMCNRWVVFSTSCDTF
ncbi:hypothetical protein SCLCIDRAFT_1019904 [Scleroderma citrinum Foug A]|uniref:Uncharacterized protein n=1 Tax=Scleroderma citrinum Foug A TaxID=1036808 RepID=A0A0C3DF89_9AGAM|nr:hypothetical protein SCLCIDRAFT_1019904 [Scleroderma citrinum Foug A]